MRSGFNTNVRHRGTLFHVQTEDSGRANPHLITHLFHEGTILSSEKQSYADSVDDEGLGDAVKQLMESQHLGMLERLGAGQLDDEIAARLGAEIFSATADRAEAEGGTTQPDLRDSTTGASTAKTPRQRAPLAADAPLDEMVLDYLAERGPGTPGAR